MYYKSIISICLICLIGFSCAKQEGRFKEHVYKVGTSPEASAYVDFIRADIEKYDKDLEVVLKDINKLILVNPGIGYLYYQRAVVNSGLSSWEAVVADCEKALEFDPQNLDAKILLGRASGVLNNHKDSIKYLKQALKEAPKREDIYIFLAKEYLNVENYKAAERVMQDLLSRDSEAIVAYYYLGAIYGAYLRQPNKAIDIYEKLLVREPENVQVIDAISVLYLEVGQSGKALAMLLKLEKQKPGDIALKLKLAKIFYKLKKYDDAALRFEDILRQNPNSDKIAYYLGVLYQEIGKTDQAMENYYKINSDSGLFKDAQIRIAHTYKLKGNISESKNVLNAAIKRKPDTAEFYQYLASIYEQDGDTLSAIKVLEKAGKRFPSNEKIFFSIATLYDRLGEPDKAVSTMQKVLQVNPDNANALNFIGYSYANRGINLIEAEDMLQQAVRLRPTDGFIIDSLAWLYFKKGDLDKTKFYLDKALALQPNEPTILKHVGELNLKQGSSKKALTYFNKALKVWKKRTVIDEKEVLEIMSLIQQAMGGI